MSTIHEAVQVGAGAEQLRAKPATQGEIRLEGLAERCHRAPLAVGQGMATSRRASKSSLA